MLEAKKMFPSWERIHVLVKAEKQWASSLETLTFSPQISSQSKQHEEVHSWLQMQALSLGDSAGVSPRSPFFGQHTCPPAAVNHSS